MMSLRRVKHTIIINYDERQKKKFREDLYHYEKDENVYIIYKTFRDGKGGQIKFCYKK